MTVSTDQRSGVRPPAATRALLTLAFAALCACGDESQSGSSSASSSRSVGGSSASSKAAESKALPATGVAAGFNVLLVTLDTVRADALGCYGERLVRTPNIDRLASHGVRYERALAPAPITLPSHATLLTGLDPISHGVRNNGTFRLDESRNTLAEQLREHGYDTAAVVASFVLDSRFGLAQGFSTYDDDLSVDGVSAGEGHYVERKADRVTARAIDWLAKPHEQPFFLWTHYFDAHAPYAAPTEFLPAGVNLDPNAPFDPQLNRARYVAEVSYADSERGKLLDAIGEERLRRTIVVVTADHGEGLGEHGEYTHSRLIYDGTMRVPLIVSNPVLFDGARVVKDRVVGLVDVMPTLVGVLGVEAHNAFDGEDLFRAPADPQRGVYGECMATLYNHGWAPLHSWSRVGDKFIQAPRPEYYDIARDPAESQNLYRVQGAKAQPLSQALSARLKRAESSAPKEREMTPDEARTLAELGYSRSTPAAEGAGVLDPKDAITTWAVLTNAQTFSAQGQFDRALADIARVLQTNPADPFAWETSYVVHLRRGELEEAEKSIRRGLELNPTSEGYVRFAWLLIQRGKFNECEPVLKLAERLEPNHGEIFLIRGELLLRDGRDAEALEQFELAARVDPVRTKDKAKLGIDAARAKLRAGG